MSLTDVGKDAKHMGRVKPSTARKLDPANPRPTPENRPRPKVHKRFGFEARVRYRHWRTKEWNAWGKWSYIKWYETAKKRDQALRDYHGYFRQPDRYEAEARPVERS